MYDKVVLITGGASGIGRAVGAELARRGAEVCLADRQAELAEDAAAQIRGAGGRAVGVALDVREPESWRSVVEPLLARTGRIDYLFNNAGIGVGGLAESYDREDWDDVIDVNLRGVAYGVHAVYPRMIQQGSGHIVNTASVLGFLVQSGNSVYVATKHGVVGLSKALRVEAAPYGVRVSVVCPGAVRTPILHGGEFGRLKPDVPVKLVDRMWEQVKPVTPEAFARRVVPRVLAGDFFIVEPPWWRWFWYLSRLSPELTHRLAARAHQRFIALAERYREREGQDAAPG